MHIFEIKDKDGSVLNTRCLLGILWYMRVAKLLVIINRKLTKGAVEALTLLLPVLHFCDLCGKQQCQISATNGVQETTHTSVDLL